MKLLVITQKVDFNDNNLGFFHSWIEKFAEKAENVFVITNKAGEYNFPVNVKIFSLGKEKGFSRIKRYSLFYKFFLKDVGKCDKVFFHMCPEYVLAGGWISKILGKENILWYTHKSVSLRLKLAEKLVDKIFTASKESCRLNSKKIEITGHGIDTSRFTLRVSRFKSHASRYRIITAGRIARVKNYDFLVEAAKILKERNMRFEIEIAGVPILKEDEIYFDNLKKEIKEKNLMDCVRFVGPIPYMNISEFYQKGDLFVNLSDTGSIDKTVLEAMASGIAVLTSNEAFKNILDEKYFTKKDAREIAEKIIGILETDFNDGEKFRNYVAVNHNLNNLIDKILC